MIFTVYLINPIKQLHIGINYSIRSFISYYMFDKETSNKIRYYLIQENQKGSILKLNPFSSPIELDIVHEFHACNILGLATSPKEHLIATVGEDGTIRLYDYYEQKCLFLHDGYRYPISIKDGKKQFQYIWFRYLSLSNDGFFKISKLNHFNEM